MAIEKFSEASGQEGNELADFIRGDGSKTLANAQKFKQAHYAGRTDLGWRLQKKGLQVVGKFFQLIVYTEKRLGVTLRIFLDFFSSAARVRPPSNDLSVMKGNLQKWVARYHAQTK
jgi:hypothetical protein